MPGRHTDASIIPFTTQRTCTDRSCDGSCGRTNHPYAVLSWPADGTAGPIFTDPVADRMEEIETARAAEEHTGGAG